MGADGDHSLTRRSTSTRPSVLRGSASSVPNVPRRLFCRAAWALSFLVCGKLQPAMDSTMARRPNTLAVSNPRYAGIAGFDSTVPAGKGMRIANI